MIEVLCAFNLIAQRENEPREFKCHDATSDECFIADVDAKNSGRIEGVMPTNLFTFFKSPTIKLVHPRSKILS